MVFFTKLGHLHDEWGTRHHDGQYPHYGTLSHP